MKVAMNGRKVFLALLTTFSVFGVGTLAIVNTDVLAGTPKPDYSLSATSDTVTQPGVNDPPPLAEFTITMLPGAGGYPNPVSLTYSGLPKGVTDAQWSDNGATVSTGTPSIDLSFHVPASVKVGTYQFTVTGKNQFGKDARDVKVTLGVAAPSSAGTGYSLTLNPTAQTVLQGDHAAYGVQLLPAASFNGTVTLSAKGLPGGTTASFSPSNATTTTVTKAAPNATLTLITTTKTHAGVYHFTVEGVSGKSRYDVTAQLTVQAPAGSGFTLALSPTQQQVAAGGTTTFALGISRSSAFIGVPITLAVDGLPTDANASFDVDNPTDSDGATITISTNEITTPDGNFEFTVTGKSDAPAAFAASVKAHLVVNTPAGKTFGITGIVPNDMTPGAQPQSIDLKLANPNDKPILITNLVVAISGIDVDPTEVSSSSPSCTKDDFALTQYGGGYPLRLEKKTTQTLSGLGVLPDQLPTIQLINDAGRNQDACKSATVHLAYSGNAREAG